MPEIQAFRAVPAPKPLTERDAGERFRPQPPFSSLRYSPPVVDCEPERVRICGVAQLGWWRSRVTQHQRNSERKDPLKAWLRTARWNAKKKGREFSIELFDLPEIPATCPVLGTPLRLDGPPNDDNAPSLDRIDNASGYVPGNVEIISRRANRLKGDATPDELRKLADFYSIRSK